MKLKIDQQLKIHAIEGDSSLQRRLQVARMLKERGQAGNEKQKIEQMGGRLSKGAEPEHGESVGQIKCCLFAFGCRFNSCLLFTPALHRL